MGYRAALNRGADRAAHARARERLAERLTQYYAGSSTYHGAIGEAAEERPSAEERPVLAALAALSAKDRAEGSAARAVLDIGCGACGSAEALLAATGASAYYGVDASPFAIEEARRAHPAYHLAVGDATALDFPDGMFDVVLSTYVLEHMVYPERMLDEAVRVTRPGGLIALIVPVSDLPWAMPASLRHKRGDVKLAARYTLERWAEALRLRYDPAFFAWRSVEDPIALRQPPGYAFLPDDDLVYVGSTRELKKYLAAKGCEVVWQASRDIASYIANGRRPLVDLARRAAFLCFRASVATLDAQEYTTTVSLIVRTRRLR